MADIEELARRFRANAVAHEARSPFNSRLSRAIADDPAIVSILCDAPEEQQLPVLLLAAVHSIVLAEPDLPLAAWYPSVASAPRVDDPFPAFAALCRDRTDELRRLVAIRTTQTNEVGRCALLVPPLGLIAVEVGPVGLVDVGASAGLNLRLDRYRYEYDTRDADGDEHGSGASAQVVGEPSPVALRCELRGEAPIPSQLPMIVARLGIDRAPIDLSDADSVRWLMACVWPDQRDRFQRLRAAIGLAQQHGVVVERSDAVAALAGAVARVGTAAHPVVFNSWVLNYLSNDHRVAYAAELDRIGAERDLSWVFVEAPAMTAGLPFPPDIADQHVSAVVLVRWRHGEREVAHLADAHPHGYWLRWRA